MNWFEIRDFIKSAAPDDESEDALIVFAAAHHRVAQKYASFAYRVVQLDGGVALAQMKATAAGIGLRLRVAREWCEPAILDGLDLTPFAEIVTGIAHVKGARADLGGIQ